MRPYTIATRIHLSARVLYRVRRNGSRGTQSVTSKALISVLCQKDNGDKVMRQVARDCQGHFDRFLEHGAVTFLASGEVCGIVWKWTCDVFTREESIEHQRPAGAVELGLHCERRGCSLISEVLEQQGEGMELARVAKWGSYRTIVWKPLKYCSISKGWTSQAYSRMQSNVLFVRSGFRLHQIPQKSK